MARVKRLLSAILPALVLSCALGCAPAARAEPQHVKIGVFMTNLYGINFADNQFTTGFWAWFVHDDPSFKPDSNLEVTNAKSVRTSGASRDTRSGRIWDQVKYEVTVAQRWRIADYPFDRQFLRFTLESIDRTGDQLVFDADDDNSRVDSALVVDGWHIVDLSVGARERIYDTSYGDPAQGGKGTSNYSSAIVTVEMKRDGWRLLFYNFVGFVFAISLAGIVLLTNARLRLIETVPLTARLSLATGALFASVGAAYVLQGRLPSTPQFTLADAIQATAFAGTMMAVVASITSEVLVKAGRPRAAARIGMAMLAVYILVGIGSDGLLLVRAVAA